MARPGFWTHEPVPLVWTTTSPITVGVVAVSAFVAMFASEGNPIVLALCVLAGLTLLFVEFLLGIRKGFKQVARLRSELIEDNQLPFTWLVEVVLSDGSAPIGTDQGVLWVQDSILFFSGRACSFAIGPRQIKDFKLLTFSVDSPGADLKVSIVFLERLRAREEFFWRIREMWTHPPRGEFDLQYPPAVSYQQQELSGKVTDQLGSREKIQTK